MLTPWVILFFYLGVLGVSGDLSQVVPNLGGLRRLLWRSTVALIGFIALAFLVSLNWHRLIGIRPYGAIAFSRSHCRISVNVFLIYPLGQSGWFFCAIVWRCGDLLDSYFATFKVSHNWTLNPFHMMGACWYSGWSIPVSAIHGVTMWQTHCHRG